MKAGFTPTLTDRDLDDPESKARQRAIQEQKRLLTISLILTIPLFILQMGSEFGLLPAVISQAPWLNWVLFALATPVQFYVGRSYYINGWKALKMALPTWTCWSLWALLWHTSSPDRDAWHPARHGLL